MQISICENFSCSGIRLVGEKPSPAASPDGENGRAWPPDKGLDYPIDWPSDDDTSLIYHKEVYENVSKIKENTHIQVIRPEFIKIKGLNYATLFFTHKLEIEHQIEEFKPDVILALGY